VQRRLLARSLVGACRCAAIAAEKPREAGCVGEMIDCTFLLRSVCAMRYIESITI